MARNRKSPCSWTRIALYEEFMWISPRLISRTIRAANSAFGLGISEARKRFLLDNKLLNLRYLSEERSDSLFRAESYEGSIPFIRSIVHDQ